MTNLSDQRNIRFVSIRLNINEPKIMDMVLIFRPEIILDVDLDFMYTDSEPDAKPEI